MLYSLQDITLIPATVSEISSRSQCNPHADDFGMLPLFVAPMSSVIDDKNWRTFHDHKINTIIPRNIDIETRLKLSHNQLTFVAFSLDEFETYFCKEISYKANVLIDVANGHMKKLIDLCKKAKEINGDNVIIMAGNVANPETYVEYAQAGIDYCRMSIGSGSQCTTANTGIFYPMGSLLIETNKHKESIKLWSNHPDCPYKSIPKIVADGGFNTFGDIIKALALGADYVMCGKIFAKSVEACGEIRSNINPLNYDILKDGPFNEWIRTQDISRIKFLECYREYYGMSTKRAQLEFGKEGTKTEEGIQSYIKIEYYLSDWVCRFIDYLCSAMSYTNSFNLSDFIGEVKYQILSPTAIRTFK